MKWKGLYSSITITPKNKRGKVLEWMMKQTLKNNPCIEHMINRAIFDGWYRLYRRGKNRCIKCGVRL